MCIVDLNLCDEQMRQQTLTDFIFDAKKTKNEVMGLLQTAEVDLSKIEDRKKNIIQIHDDVIIVRCMLLLRSFTHCIPLMAFDVRCDPILEISESEEGAA